MLKTPSFVGPVPSLIGEIPEPTAENWMPPRSPVLASFKLWSSSAMGGSLFQIHMGNQDLVYDSMAWMRQNSPNLLSEITLKIKDMNVPTVLFIIYTIYICIHILYIFIHFSFSYHIHPRWNIGWAAVHRFCRYEIWGHRSPSYKKVCPTQKAALQNDAAGAPHIPRWSLQKATRIFVLNAETRCMYD